MRRFYLAISNEVVIFSVVSMPGTICTPPQFSIDRVQKHSETALDTPENEGTKSSFPIKVHAIPGKTPAICEFLVVQMWCKIQKKNRKSLKIKDLRFVMCPEPGSNRHGLLHWCLRPARLPIPPSGLVWFGPEGFPSGGLRLGWNLAGEAVPSG